ncbi:MAG TPA: tetratricopeptide repeat protein [Opitutaceae bacterium]|jgi:tetratricopeptide (TPR) repeat protein|nr:tetratricopeptide repeat protein [Opitutaceae bacterium]
MSRPIQSETVRRSGRRAPMLLAAVALVLVLAGGWAIWRHRLSAERAAAIPASPDLSRWSPDFVRAIEQTTAEARTARDPRPTLARLAALYHANGFEAQAETLVSHLERSEPGTARWAYLAADLRARQSDREGQLIKLRRALELDPTYAPGWIRLGDLLVERSAFSEAEPCYDRARELSPGDARAAYAAIAFQAWHGKRGDPRAALRELGARHPGIVQVHELLAEMEKAAGDAAASARERQRAAAATRFLDTTDPWLDELGQFCHDPTRLGLITYKLQREGRLEDAEKLLTHALRVAPAEPSLRISLAQVHEQAGRPARALQVLEQAVRELPDASDLLLQLARRLSLDRRTEDALSVVRAALQRWPAEVELHLALGYTLRDAGRHAEALPAFVEAGRLDPNRVEPLYFQAFSQLALGRREQARDAVDEALRKRPDYPEALTLRASLAIEAGDLTRAEPLIRRLHALRPEDTEARVLFVTLHLLLGLAREEAGAPEQADRLYRQGLDVQADFGPLLRQAGRLAWAQRRWPEAVALLGPYRTQEPADLEAQLWFGLALRGVGQGEPARAVLTQGRTRAQAAGDADLAARFERALQP